MPTSDDELYGLVYFIGHGSLGPVKIGFTADRDPGPRLRQLQTGSPEELDILGTIGAYASIERKIHRFLAPHNIRGEWFERDAALALLQRLKDHEIWPRSDFIDQFRWLRVVGRSPTPCTSTEGEPLHIQVANDILLDIAEQLCKVNTTRMLPFRAWLLTQVGRDDPTGDLARDASVDPAFPPLGRLIDYLAYVKSESFKTASFKAAVVRASLDAWMECDRATESLTIRAEE